MSFLHKIDPGFIEAAVVIGSGYSGATTYSDYSKWGIQAAVGYSTLMYFAGKMTYIVTGFALESLPMNSTLKRTVVGGLSILASFGAGRWLAQKSQNKEVRALSITLPAMVAIMGVAGFLTVQKMFIRA